MIDLGTAILTFFVIFFGMLLYVKEAEINRLESKLTHTYKQLN